MTQKTQLNKIKPMNKRFINNLDEDKNTESNFEVIITGILTVALGALFFLILWLY